MKLKKQTLLYDISNLAWMIADTGEDHHTLHRVRDICEEGNIDRVSRVLGLAFSNVLVLLAPVLNPAVINLDRDSTKEVHDFPLHFRNDYPFCHTLTPEIKLKIKETVREYMVALTLADWLGVTLPEAADVWRHRCQLAFESLSQLISSLSPSSLCGFQRRLSPF